jgi:MFS transporter, OFA family, oxalate/formate antiporter
LSSATFGPLIGVHCARFFGRKHLGAISGLQMTFNVLASAGGPALFALSLRFTDSYRAILILCIVTAAALAASIKPARPPLYPHPSKA